MKPRIKLETCGFPRKDACVRACVKEKLLVHFLYFTVSSSSQIFCVRDKVHMWNFTGGRAKDTLDYMVRKYELRGDGSWETQLASDPFPLWYLCGQRLYLKTDSNYGATRTWRTCVFFHSLNNNVKIICLFT